MSRQQGAEAAVAWYRQAIGRGAARSDDLVGWQHWRGSSRIALLAPGEDTVYKIELTYAGSNQSEHENMCRWRKAGKAWAPETTLFIVDNHDILAMPYYPDRISSPDDIPADARAVILDFSLENWRRRRADGQAMLIDAGEVLPTHE